MAVTVPGLVTVNTDAGFYQWNGLASYAYWIRFNGQLWSASGMLKEKQKGASYAEERAVLNALYIVDKYIPSGIVKIILNTDCKTLSANPDHTHGKQIHDALRLIHKKHIIDAGKSTLFEKFFEFRHVKAHSEADNKRTWVNNKLDEMCKMELRNAALELALQMRKEREKLQKKKRR